MVEVTKNLENRHQALKWMHSQGTTGFLYKDVLDKYAISPTFLSAASKKNLVKVSGAHGSVYIGPEPTIKLAVEVYDFEKQIYNKNKKVAKFPKKMVNVEGLDKFKGIVNKALETQVEYDLVDSSTRKIVEKIIPTTEPVEQELTVKIKNGMVIMNWEDFGKLLNK